MTDVAGVGGTQGDAYARSGVNYAAMDPTKVNAQNLGRATAHHLERFGYREVPESRGESVYLMERLDDGPDGDYLAFVVEGLGTKNLVADAMFHLLGRRIDDKYARDALAMILGDMITAGALPMVTGQYLAVGSDRWFANPDRSGRLAIGWTEGCDESGAVYACGETPTLRDIIVPTAADLAGAAIGIIKPKDRRIDPSNIADGDAIVMFESSGIHANGLTLVRDIAEQIGYGFRLSDGTTFGEAICEPSILYVRLMEVILDAGIRPHYAVNITGHGWRKLMRATEPFVYVIDELGSVPEVFAVIQRFGGLSTYEMYGNYNMGAGFALIVDPSDVDPIIELAASEDILAWPPGHVEKRGDEKAVVIKPLGLTYEGDTLQVR